MLAYRPDAVKEIRVAKGYTVTELAKRAGITLRGLFYIEHQGRDPRASTLGRLASALEVPVNAFFVKTKKR